MSKEETVTVLTTAEHAPALKLVFGEDADYRFDAGKIRPLEQFLANLTIGGGTAVVLDEEFFLSAKSMLDGIAKYVNDKTWRGRCLRIIVLCPRRKADDPMLFALAAQCGIYDLVYDVNAFDVVPSLLEMMTCPRRRYDVLDILSCEAPDESPLQGTAQGGNFEFPIKGGQRLTISITVEPS